MSRDRRRGLRLLLLVLFVGVPLLEIYVLIQVGHVIGGWWTLGLLVADSVFGTWLIKREGSRAWTALRTALQSGRMPGRELADGALILIGGTLMLSPGFVTDVFGLAMILPFTRPFARRVLTALVGRRLLAASTRPTGATWPGPGSPGQTNRPGPRVVRGEVVDDD